MKSAIDASLRAAEGSRRAALAVHAMSETDRAWVLGRLPVSERQTLHRLLGELKTLAIPADRSIVQEMLTDTTPARMRAESMVTAIEVSPEQMHVQVINATDVAALREILETEPAAVTASILRAHPWTWSAAFFEQIGAAKRPRIEEALQALDRSDQAGAAPVAMNRALLAAVYRRIAARALLTTAPRCDATTPTRAQRGWGRRLRDGLLRRRQGRA